MIRKVKRASSQLESFEFELESLANVYFGLAFQISGELDIWPRAARSIISEGEASALSSVNIKASIETYPYGITHHISTVGEANIVSALSYNAGIEVFPLENQ